MSRKISPYLSQKIQWSAARAVWEWKLGASRSMVREIDHIFVDFKGIL